ARPDSAAARDGPSASATPARRARRRCIALHRRARHIGAGSRGPRDHPRPDRLSPRRAAPAAPPVVGPPRRGPPTGGRPRAALVAGAGADDSATVVLLVLRPARCGGHTPCRRGVALPPRQGFVPGAGADRRRALQRRAPAPGASTCRLDPLCVGGLRAPPLPPRRPVRSGSSALAARRNPRPRARERRQRPRAPVLRPALLHLPVGQRPLPAVCWRPPPRPHPRTQPPGPLFP